MDWGRSFNFLFYPLYRGASFRSEFSRIGEVRSLIPRGVNLMALTATATKSICRRIIQSLCLENCCIVCKNPLTVSQISCMKSSLKQL